MIQVRHLYIDIDVIILNNRSSYSYYYFWPHVAISRFGRKQGFSRQGVRVTALVSTN